MSAEKKIFAKKSTLSATVLDYYKKYGQNRDLEKYLRVRKQNSSKSSSDGSLHNFERNASAAEAERVRRSLQKLCIDENKEKIPSSPQTKSQEEIKSAGGGRSASTDRVTPPKVKVEKKGQFRKKSKSKSYNMNLESSIEITLPSTQSMPELLQQSSKASLPLHQSPKTSIPSPRKICFESCETQTEVEPPEERLKDLPATKKLVVPVTEDRATETSPASSIASAKVRLEWDSMADVGYNKIIDFKSQSNSNLSTFEKNALRKFFAKRGLKFDNNLVIIASPDQSKKLNKHDMAKSAIEIRELQGNEAWSEEAGRKSDSRKKLSTPQRSGKNKQLWGEALSKYRQKYAALPRPSNSKVDATDSTDRSLSLLNPQGHSTPFNESEPSRRSKAKLNDNPVSHEKSCQTSAVQLEAKEVQTMPKRAYTETGTQSDLGKIFIFMYYVCST